MYTDIYIYIHIHECNTYVDISIRIYIYMHIGQSPGMLPIWRGPITKEISGS